MAEAKSVIIGRKKVGNDKYNILVSLFASEDPHLSTDSPIETHEFDAESLETEGASDFKFMPAGNDVVINGISEAKTQDNSDSVKLILK